MIKNGSGGHAAVSAAAAPRPAAVSAVAPVPGLDVAPVAIEPAPGPYLGGADGDHRHRVSFSVLNGSLRNLRVDGLAMAPQAEVRDGRVETRHLGFELTATWIDERHVEGRVRMRGRWGRGQTFRFRARHRHRDVLKG